MRADSWTDGVVGTLRVPSGLQLHEAGTMGARRHTECAYYMARLGRTNARVYPGNGDRNDGATLGLT
jgi:hypothetical protein